MDVEAGGNFAGKAEDEFVVPASDLNDVAAKRRNGTARDVLAMFRKKMYFDDAGKWAFSGSTSACPVPSQMR
jgi:hypothetical protein